MTRLLVLLMLLAASPTFAATWRDGGGWAAAPLSQGNDGVWSVLPDMRSPNNGHLTTCGTSSCTRTGDLPAPVGKGNPRLSPTATFPKAAVVTGALALGGRVLPWLSVGMGLYDWYKAANLAVDPVSGQPGEMTGQTTPTNQAWVAGNPAFTSTRFGSKDTACKASADSRQANIPGSNFSQSITIQDLSATAINCNISITFTKTTGGTQTNNYATNVWNNAGGSSCMSPTGTLTPTVGGVCNPGTFTPVSNETAQTRLNNAPITADVLRRALEEVLKAGGSLQDTGTHSVIGPSSVPGETKTKTTTAANGTTQVTTVTNNYNYNYAGNTITITTTEVIQNPDGSTETITSDTPDSLCADNPTSLACIKLGDVPTDQPAWETKTIAYQADSLGLPAACPAPWTGQLRGWTLSFSYQPACDVAPQIRLAILALTTLGALLMIVTTVRT